MYLRRVRVQNIKMMRDVELSFLRGDNVRPWTVIIGENGLCKTALLQAIALAASGPDRANQLADVGSLPRRKEEKTEAEAAKITAEFELGSITHALREYPGVSIRPETPPRIESELEIPPRWKVFNGKSRYLSFESGSEIDPLRTARAEGLPFWFVAGYGPIRMFPKLSSGDNNTGTGVENLFDRGSLFKQENTEIDKRVDKPFTGMLTSALIYLLPGVGGVDYGINSIQKNRIVYSSPLKIHMLSSKGVFDFFPVDWLSHGYQTTVAWLTDLITRLFLEAQTKDPAFAGWPFPTVDDASWCEHLEGLVLIDEIDLHLHPRWQAEIVTKLKQLFPKLQFIVTTHSPMVLPGCEQDEILIAKQNEAGDVIFAQATEAPALMTGSEIYKTFFGLDKLYPNKLGEDLQRYGYLTSDPFRTDQEETEMQQLKDKLTKANVDPGWEPVAREREA